MVFVGVEVIATVVVPTPFGTDMAAMNILAMFVATEVKRLEAEDYWVAVVEMDLYS
jgi:hypothetical protein